MSQENDQHNDDQDNSQSGSTNQPNVDQLVAQKVDEAVKKLKENLDKAYSARDAALAKNKELEDKARQAEIAQLEKEGKAVEALQKRYDDMSAENERLRRQNVELSRDVTLRELMGGLPFRNERAAKLAYKEIVSELTQDSDGSWKHKGGANLSDFVKQFSEDPDQAFLFKPKHSSGSGAGSSSSGTGEGGSTKKKSVFDMSQEEVLERASKGTLRSR